MPRCLSLTLSTVGVTVATRTRNSSSSRSGSNKGTARRGSPSSRSTRRGAAELAAAVAKKAGPPRRQPSALSHLVDGHGHDLWGIALVILAVLVGVSVYTDTAGMLGDGVGSFVAALVGGLRFLVPPALAVGGVLLIRGPSEVSVDWIPEVTTTSSRPTAPARGGGRRWGRRSACWWSPASSTCSSRSNAPSARTASMPTPMAEV